MWPLRKTRTFGRILLGTTRERTQKASGIQAAHYRYAQRIHDDNKETSSNGWNKHPKSSRNSKTSCKYRADGISHTNCPNNADNHAPNAIYVPNRADASRHASALWAWALWARKCSTIPISDGTNNKAEVLHERTRDQPQIWILCI